MTQKKPLRHKKNPFLEKFCPAIKSKGIKLKGVSKYIVVDKDGVELKTSIYMQKKVDTAEYLKLYAANLGTMLGLKADATKAFWVVLYALNKQAVNADMVRLDKYVLADFFEFVDVEAFGHSYFARGINSLVKSSVLAHGKQMGTYFININVVFNGDRLALVTVLEKPTRD